MKQQANTNKNVKPSEFIKKYFLIFKGWDSKKGKSYEMIIADKKLKYDREAILALYEYGSKILKQNSEGTKVFKECATKNSKLNWKNVSLPEFISKFFLIFESEASDMSNGYSMIAPEKSKRYHTNSIELMKKIGCKVVEKNPAGYDSRQDRDREDPRPETRDEQLDREHKYQRRQDYAMQS